jgi:hypothetical protein
MTNLVKKLYFDDKKIDFKRKSEGFVPFFEYAKVFIRQKYDINVHKLKNKI